MKPELKPFYYVLKFFFVRTSARTLQRKGVLVYLKTLQAVRKGAAGSIAVFLVLQSMMIALVGAITTGVFLTVDDPRTRLWILFGLFLALFLVPLIGLIVLFSEKLWYQASGAEKMVKELVPPH